MKKVLKSLAALAFVMVLSLPAAWSEEKITANAAFPAAWEAALKALESAGLPVTEANQDRRFILSMRFVTPDELFELAFFPARLPAVAREYLYGVDQVFLSFEPAGEKTLVTLEHYINGFALFHTRVGRAASKRLSDFRLPQYIEGRSNGQLESYLLNFIQKYLTRSNS